MPSSETKVLMFAGVPQTRGSIQGLKEWLKASRGMAWPEAKLAGYYITEPSVKSGLPDGPVICANSCGRMVPQSEHRRGFGLTQICAHPGLCKPQKIRRRK